MATGPRLGRSPAERCADTDDLRSPGPESARGSFAARPKPPPGLAPQASGRQPPPASAECTARTAEGTMHMVIVMGPGATREHIDSLVDLVAAAGGEAYVTRGVSRTIIGLVGDVRQFETLDLRAMPGVSDVLRISVPYKLVSSEHQPTRSTVSVAGVGVGGDNMTVIAGPCAVETPDQTLAAAQMAKAAGASLLRGGAYKPRTSPYAFQGLGETGLKILSEVRAETGLPIVTEVVDAADVDLVADYADMLQIGTRNMQNFALLQAAGEAGRPRSEEHTSELQSRGHL